MNRWKEYFEELLNVENTHQVENKGERTGSERGESGEETKKIDEVTEAIRRLKRGKAAGHDNITAKMLQNLGEKGLELLTKLFNKIWEEEKIPKDWEVGIIIPLYKKGDSKECDSYRGITLLSTVLKVYERVLEVRLRKIIENQLEESQSGFRKGRSTQDHVFTLRQIMEKSMYKTRTYTGWPVF